MNASLTALALLLCCSYTLSAQLRGVVTDMEGEPLPFATIYIEGTTQGTVTNAEGLYELELEAGEYRVVYTYVGYQDVDTLVRMSTDPLTLDIRLPE